MRRATFLATFLAMAMALALAMAFAAPVAAGGITVTESHAESRFPEGVFFSLTATADSPITDVRLRYRILPEGLLSSTLPEFEVGTAINVSFTLEGNAPPRIYLPPGTAIEYFWELTDQAGSQLNTEPSTVVYNDDRFDWQLAQDGIINLHWYRGSQDLAQEMLKAARRTLDDMSSLLQAQVDFSIHIWIYASREDMRPALVRRSQGFESQVITAGERVSENTVLVLGSAGAMDTLRHELTHIVTAVAGEGPFGNLPAWLDEGTAVYAQASPGGFQSALQRAVDRGQVLPLRSISSPTGDPAAVDLFYGQSWSIVSYVIDTYGQDRFAQLFATFKRGATIDEAIQAVYGLNQDGLEDEWRASLDLPPRERPPAQPGREAAPTLPPSSQPVAPRPTEDEGTPIGLIVGLVAGMLALAAALGVGGYLIARRLP